MTFQTNIQKRIESQILDNVIASSSAQKRKFFFKIYQNLGFKKLEISSTLSGSF